MPKQCRKLELPESIEERRTLIKSILGKDVIIKVRNLETYFVGYISHPIANKSNPEKHEDDTTGFYFGDHEKGREKILYENLESVLIGPYIRE